MSVDLSMPLQGLLGSCHLVLFIGVFSEFRAVGLTATFFRGGGRRDSLLQGGRTQDKHNIRVVAFVADHLRLSFLSIQVQLCRQVPGEICPKYKEGIPDHWQR